MSIILRKFFILLLIISVSITTITCKFFETKSNKTSFKEQLVELFPTAVIDSIASSDHFTETYRVILKQNIDPHNASQGTFEHYMYISHANINNPTILITDGYSSKNRTTELSKILWGNQVIVEYRMYGNSRPDKIPWQHLTNDNAIEDYHLIVNKLKTIYKGKWLSSGISKGGETTLIYKSKYPNDIDVAVPYVAPLIDGLEDERTDSLINSVGGKECREKIRVFQRTVLNNREEVLTAMRNFAVENKRKFTEVPFEEALEYAVLEFPFSFWQWGGECEAIPIENATAQELFDYLQQVSGFSMYHDEGYVRYLPSFYQHMQELGYYGFNLEPVQDLLRVVKNSSNERFAPKQIKVKYNPEYIKTVREYVETRGNNILYIYGEYDPWGACAPKPNSDVDALKMILKGGHHGTRIKDFSYEDQQKIYSKLEKWLGSETQIYPLQ